MNRATASKLGLLGALYLSQGLPFGFFTQALPAMLRQAGLSLPEIGAASLLALPWALKFLWAPLVDRLQIPGFGRRRSWIIPLQLITVAVMAGLALLDPADSMSPLLVGFLVANLLAATQDIATDGLAVSLLTPKERGLGNGVQVAGYRVGMVVGGGALLVLYDDIGWTGVFLAMSALLALATLPILGHREAPSPTPARGAGLSAGLRGFLARPGAWAWLAFLVVYKAGDALGTGMLRPMLVDRGLSLGDIGWLLGTVGFIAGLVGALLGGALINRVGRYPALVGFGLLQAVAVAGYALPATGAVAPEILWSVCVLDHLAGGMATAAVFTLMMDAARPHHAGVDYTLQACAVVISTGAAAALSGLTAEHLGYVLHFVLSGGLSAVAALAVVPVWSFGGFRVAPNTT